MGETTQKGVDRKVYIECDAVRSSGKRSLNACGSERTLALAERPSAASTSKPVREAG